jgi:DNA polymerase V
MYFMKTRHPKLSIRQIFRPENKINRILPVYTPQDPTEQNNTAENNSESELKEISSQASGEERLDLNGYLIAHPSETFLVKIEGDAMNSLGLYSGDILVVDQVVENRDGRLAVGILQNKFTVKFLKVKGKQLFFASDKPELPDQEVTSQLGFDMWGVVTYVIHKPQFNGNK